MIYIYIYIHVYVCVCLCWYRTCLYSSAFKVKTYICQCAHCDSCVSDPKVPLVLVNRICLASFPLYPAVAAHSHTCFLGASMESIPILWIWMRIVNDEEYQKPRTCKISGYLDLGWCQQKPWKKAAAGEQPSLSCSGLASGLLAWHTTDTLKLQDYLPATVRLFIRYRYFHGITWHYSI